MREAIVRPLVKPGQIWCKRPDATESWWLVLSIKRDSNGEVFECRSMRLGGRLKGQTSDHFLFSIDWSCLVDV